MFLKSEVLQAETHKVATSETLSRDTPWLQTGLFCGCVKISLEGNYYPVLLPANTAAICWLLLASNVIFPTCPAVAARPAVLFRVAVCASSGKGPMN